MRQATNSFLNDIHHVSPTVRRRSIMEAPDYFRQDTVGDRGASLHETKQETRSMQQAYEQVSVLLVSWHKDDDDLETDQQVSRIANRSPGVYDYLHPEGDTTRTSLQRHVSLHHDKSNIDDQYSNPRSNSNE